ncbi:ASCH domain-containing protein [Sedimentibacter sp. zth1]|nr:ASCH domain-containing protein [Sedimentibacter sp. zth1]
MNHRMNLNPEPFAMIRNGEKTIELRLNDEKRQLIKINDEIEFINTDDESENMLCKVTNIYHFASFDDLYKELPLLKCGYTKHNILNAKSSDMNQYYSIEKQSEYGVVGIEIELL